MRIRIKARPSSKFKQSVCGRAERTTTAAAMGGDAKGVGGREPRSLKSGARRQTFPDEFHRDPASIED
jgi:hypothetical protein